MLIFSTLNSDLLYINLKGIFNGPVCTEAIYLHLWRLYALIVNSLFKNPFQMVYTLISLYNGRAD